ncbi:MAG: hypothetical protein ACR2F1_01105, partial [Nitrososphaeraceae archaeon]
EDDNDSKNNDDEDDNDSKNNDDEDDNDSKNNDDEDDNDSKNNDDEDEKEDAIDTDKNIPITSSYSKYDKFGIEKIYPTKTGGEEWFLNMNNIYEDKQFFPFGESDSKYSNSNLKITKNEDLTWKIESDNKSAKVRMNVYTSEGYHPEGIKTLDQSELEDTGYMQSEKDWKNTEITGYVKLNHNNIPLNEGRFTWYNRGGHHTEGQPCEGVAYKGDIFFSGDNRFAKEQWHVSYFFTDIKKNLNPIKDKWIGYKFIVFNLEKQSDPSKTVVKMESWIDYNNDGKWIKINEYTDKGKWGDSGKECDGKKDQIISWGGPIATFRWDQADDVDFKNFSVREIQSPINQ